MMNILVDVSLVFPVYTGINRDLPNEGTRRVSVPCIHRDKSAFTRFLSN